MPVTKKEKKKTKISKEQLDELQKLIIEDKAKSISVDTAKYRNNQSTWLKQLNCELQAEKSHEDWESTISLPFTYTECDITSTRIYQALTENNLVVCKPTSEEDVEISKKVEDWFNDYLKNRIKGFDDVLERTITTTTRLGMGPMYSYYSRDIGKILHRRTFEKLVPENFIDDSAFDEKCREIIDSIYAKDFDIEETNPIKETGLFKYEVKYKRKTPVASIKDKVADMAKLDFYPYEDELKVEVDVEENIIKYDGVKTQKISLDNIWFPSTIKNNEELQECNYVGIKFETNYSEIARNYYDGAYDLLSEDDLEMFKNNKNVTRESTPIDQTVQRQAGIQKDSESDVSKSIPYENIFKKYDINGDGFDEDIFIVYFPDHKKIAQIRWVNEVFKSGERPVDILTYGIREDSIYSYGVIELLKDIQSEIDLLYNQYNNYNTLINTPFGVIKKQSSFGNNLEQPVIKVKPLELIELDDVNDLKFPYIPNNQSWNLTAMEVLTQQGQAVIGTNDAMLGKQQFSRTPVGSTLKLLAEANIRIKQILVRMNRGLKSHLRKIYQLARDYGPAEQIFRIMGEKGDFQFYSITREELANMPDFDLGTSIDNINKVYMREVWLLLMEKVLNPFLVQTGLIQNPGIYEMLKKIFEVYEIKDFAKIVTKPPVNDLISQEEENILMMQGIEVRVNPMDDDKEHLLEIMEFEANTIKMAAFPPEYSHLLTAHKQSHRLRMIEEQMQAQMVQQQMAQMPQNTPMNIQRPKSQPMMPPGGQPQGMMPTTQEAISA